MKSYFNWCVREIGLVFLTVVLKWQYFYKNNDSLHDSSIWHEADENWALLGYYAASSGNLLSKF